MTVVPALQKELPLMTVLPLMKVQPETDLQRKTERPETILMPVLHSTTPRTTLPPLNSRLLRSQRPHLSQQDPPSAVPASVSACLNLLFRLRH